MLKNKKILLCVTGGIAAYKAVDLASKLKKENAEVKVVLTENATKFITPLTFKSIINDTVSTDMFDPELYIEHITLAAWADQIVIAPATANIIGKIASGIADDLVSSIVIAATCPVLFVPAMNINMFANSIVQNNIQKLVKLNYRFLEPESGVMACGTTGKGRYPKTEEIIFAIKSSLNYQQDFVGKSILITAGACRENLDPMRFLSNNSTGKMGIALARAAYLRGADVTLIHSNISVDLPHYINGIQAISAEEMYKAVFDSKKGKDIIIKTAAVTDYTFKDKKDKKIKKMDNMNLELVRTKDILLELGKTKESNQILVGFAAESNDLIQNAKQKLERKNLDMIVANSINVSGKNDTEVTILSKKDSISSSGSKFLVANKILDQICKIAQE